MKYYLIYSSDDPRIFSLISSSSKGLEKILVREDKNLFRDGNIPKPEFGIKDQDNYEVDLTSVSKVFYNIVPLTKEDVLSFLNFYNSNENRKKQ
ncbi:MAG: hypothetical protein QXX55_00225 [Candidatus Pacearchaeota archaeon]